MSNEKEVLESMGYDELLELTDPAGRTLEPVRVPVLPSNIAMRYNGKLQAVYEKVYEGFKNLTPDSPQKEKDKVNQQIVKEFSSEESIDLQLEMTAKTMGISEEELGKAFSQKALNLIYGQIIERNFTDVVEIMTRNADRFNIIFGAGDATNPTKETEKSTGTP